MISINATTTSVEETASIQFINKFTLEKLAKKIQCESIHCGASCVLVVIDVANYLQIIFMLTPQSRTSCNTATTDLLHDSNRPYLPMT